MTLPGMRAWFGSQVSGPETLSALYHFARQFAHHGHVRLDLNVPARVAKTQGQLKQLEVCHHVRAGALCVTRLSSPLTG